MEIKDIALKQFLRDNDFIPEQLAEIQRITAGKQVIVHLSSGWVVKGEHFNGGTKYTLLTKHFGR